jgi:hypothetical protein
MFMFLPYNCCMSSATKMALIGEGTILRELPSYADLKGHLEKGRICDSTDIIYCN